MSDRSRPTSRPRSAHGIDGAVVVGFAERHVVVGAAATVVLLVLGGAALGAAGGSVLARLVQAVLAVLAVLGGGA